MVAKITGNQPLATNQAATSGEMVKPGNTGVNRGTPGNTTRNAIDKKKEEQFQKNQEIRQKQLAQLAKDEEDVLGEITTAVKDINTGSLSYGNLDPSTISQFRYNLQASVKAARGDKTSPLYKAQATMTSLEQILSGSSVANRKDLTMQLALAKSNYVAAMRELGRTAMSNALKTSPKDTRYEVVDNPSRIRMDLDIKTGLDGREKGLDEKQLAFVKQELTAAINNARRTSSPLRNAEHWIQEYQTIINNMGGGSNDDKQALENAKSDRIKALRDLAQKCITQAQTP